MNKEEILNAVQSLSKSQGFYCRVYTQLLENPEILDYLESMQFKDVVDLVLFFET